MDKDRPAFDDRVMNDYIPHIIKMVANAPPDGEMFEELINSPSYKYVEDVQNKLNKIDEAIKQCELAARQVENPPPNHWLNSMGLSLADHFQKQLDDATLYLFSVFDKCLLLINSVLDLQIDPRQCRYEKVKNRVNNNDELLKALQKLNQTVKPLADLRNFYVHRGEPREMVLIDTLKIIELLGERREITTEQDVPAVTRRHILETMRSEITKINALVEEVKGNLLASYKKRLEELGGVMMPSQQEVTVFREVLESITGTEPAEFVLPPEFDKLH